MSEGQNNRFHWLARSANDDEGNVATVVIVYFIVTAVSLLQSVVNNSVSVVQIVLNIEYSFFITDTSKELSCYRRRMNSLLLRNVRVPPSPVASLLQYQCRANASTATTPASSSSGSVVQSTPIVLDNRKPAPPLDADRMRMHPRIGNREIVGYGLKGKPEYFDLVMFPCPSIRWEADTPEIAALRKKEKGDWKQLSVNEKKQCKCTHARTMFATAISSSSVPGKFPSDIRRVHRSHWYLEVGSWMDIDFVSGRRFRLRWMATHLYVSVHE